MGGGGGIATFCSAVIYFRSKIWKIVINHRWLNPVHGGCVYCKRRLHHSKRYTWNFSRRNANSNEIIILIIFAIIDIPSPRRFVGARVEGG